MPVPEETLKRFGGVQITSEMRTIAESEILRREPHIQHHFTTGHFTQNQSDTIGFYGEFGLRVTLGLDWKTSIRPDYFTINSHDILVDGWVIDVKTESIPARYMWSVVKRVIPDNEYYGRRLYHTGQRNLLGKYDILVMGAVLRERRFREIDAWFPTGWLPAAQVLSYPAGQMGPRHRSGKQILYPFPAFQITTADLRGIEELRCLLKQPKSFSQA